eukprot:9342319-Pyramimonas_sp.AAC.1
MRGKRALRRAVGLALMAGVAWYRGQRITRASAAQRVTPETVAELTQLSHRADDRVLVKVKRDDEEQEQRATWKQRTLK